MDRTLFAHPPEAPLHQSAGISREMAVYFVGFFPAADPDLAGIDHNHMIARIQERSVGWLGLTHQQHSCLAGELAQNHVLGVYHMPTPADLVLGRECSTHRHTSPANPLQSL